MNRHQLLPQWPAIEARWPLAAVAWDRDGGPAWASNMQIRTFLDGYLAVRSWDGSSRSGRARWGFYCSARERWFLYPDEKEIFGLPVTTNTLSMFWTNRIDILFYPMPRVHFGQPPIKFGKFYYWGTGVFFEHFSVTGIAVSAPQPSHGVDVHIRDNHFGVPRPAVTS